MTNPPIAIRDTRRRHWAWFEHALIDVHGATIGAAGIAVYIALARYAHNEDQTCWPATRPSPPAPAFPAAT